MQAVLVMFRSDGERRSFSVTRGITVIGRRDDCDLRIPLGDVSRKHCRLVREDDVLRLEDLGSSNGTYHNGVRVEKDAVLQAGDSIQIGPVVFVLQLSGVPADEDLHPITNDAAAPGGFAEGYDAGVGADYDATPDMLDPIEEEYETPAGGPPPMPVPPPMPGASRSAPPPMPASAPPPLPMAADDEVIDLDSLEPDHLEPAAEAAHADDEPISLDDLDLHDGSGVVVVVDEAHVDDDAIALDDLIDIEHQPTPGRKQ